MIRLNIYTSNQWLIATVLAQLSIPSTNCTQEKMGLRLEHPVLLREAALLIDLQNPLEREPKHEHKFIYKSIAEVLQSVRCLLIFF